MQARTAEIASELYHSLGFLGARSDLLGIVGSWGDSLTDDQVLGNLKTWNAATAVELRAYIENFETTSHRQRRSRGAGQQIA